MAKWSKNKWDKRPSAPTKLEGPLSELEVAIMVSLRDETMMPPNLTFTQADIDAARNKLEGLWFARTEPDQVIKGGKWWFLTKSGEAHLRSLGK